MSLYDIRKDFSYALASSSIDYIRNYNFNPDTVTILPLSMSNANDKIPITVDISTSEPWIQITDPITGRNLKVPDGNVILQPTSSQGVIVSVNLPPELDYIKEAAIYPNILLTIKSGSYPRQNTRGVVDNREVLITPSATSVKPGEQITLVLTTKNIPNSTALFWTIRPETVVDTNTFIDGKVNGTVTINNNLGQLILAVKSDFVVSTSKLFIVDIYDRDPKGTVPAILLESSDPVTLFNTTSTPPISNPQNASRLVPELTNYTIRIDEFREIGVALYDAAGNLNTTTDITWTVAEGSANIEMYQPTTSGPLQGSPYYATNRSRIIRGLRPGTAKIRVYSGLLTATMDINVPNVTRR